MFLVVFSLLRGGVRRHALWYVGLLVSLLKKLQILVFGAVGDAVVASRSGHVI